MIDVLKERNNNLTCVSGDTKKLECNSFLLKVNKT